MTRTGGQWLAALVLAALAPVRGDAGTAPDCPRSSYSPFHYWTPTLCRVCDCLQSIHVHMPTCSSQTPITIRVTPFRCPAVDATTLFQIVPYGNMTPSGAPGGDPPQTGS
jgi:hypothetical protein